MPSPFSRASGIAARIRPGFIQVASEKGGGTEEARGTSERNGSKCQGRNIGLVFVLRKTGRGKPGVANRRQSSLNRSCLKSSLLPGVAARGDRSFRANRAGFALELSSSHCGFTWPGGVLVQSRNKDILDVIHRGNAFLTRLEGEWWMRFCDLSETGNDKQISSFRRAAVNGTVSKSGASTGSAADDWAQKGCQGTNNGARQAAVCAG